MTNNKSGMFGENGIWFIVLILFFLGGMGGFGFGGNRDSALQNSLTRAELYEGLNTQDIKNSLNSLSAEMNCGISSVKDIATSGFAGIQLGMNNGFNSVNSSIANLGYQVQNCCCDLKTTIHNEGEQTRALIQANLVQDLRDKVADKDRELLTTGLVAAQTLQTNNIENFIRNILNGCNCGC